MCVCVYHEEYGTPTNIACEALLYVRRGVAALHVQEGVLPAWYG